MDMRRQPERDLDELEELLRAELEQDRAGHDVDQPPRRRYAESHGRKRRADSFNGMYRRRKKRIDW